MPSGRAAGAREAEGSDLNPLPDGSPGCDCRAMNRRRVLLASPLLALVASPSRAQLNQLPTTTTITFAAGSTSSTNAGQLAPGGRAGYYVLAKAGQTLTVSLMPVATGISFQVFRADATLARGTDGLPVATGGTLPDAGPNDNATAWVGAIPRDGNYLILVSSKAAASGPYNLTVSLQ